MRTRSAVGGCATELPPVRPRGDNGVVRNSLVRSVVWSFVSLAAVAACGGDDGGGYTPPPGSLIDAPPAGDGGTTDSLGDGGTPDGGVTDGGVTLDGATNSSEPEITVVAPPAGALIAGVMRLEVTVTDPDGVASVTATIGASGTIPMTRTAPTSDTWSGVYDTAALAGVVAPTILVRAVDSIGTQGQRGFAVTLDNAPPLVAFDPPNVRLIQTTDTGFACSEDFDPVGGDAPNDGEVVPQLVELRARSTDLPNTGTANTTLFIPYAGVQRVQMYVLDDTTRPLVVDTDGDGFCDNINPDIKPTATPVLATEAALVTLEAVPGGGAASFQPDTIGSSNAARCAPGNATETPEPLCFGELFATVAIDTPFTDEPEVFGIGPADMFNCLGYAFDTVANNVDEGWACVAAVATDNLGNRSVSAPLRICVDANNSGDCGGGLGTTSSLTRPACTGTVTAGVVTATACTPRAYGTVGNDFEIIYP